MIVTHELVRTFGDFTAVAGVDFTVAAGEIFGLLGPNGAGKSTIIKMLSTLLRPTSGTAQLAGFDVVAQPNEVRRAIGMVFQDPSLDDRLTAAENLAFHARLYRVAASTLEERSTHLLSMVGLLDRRHAVVKTFSGGMKRRLEIARGLLHHPRILFLDEPTIGLDPQTRSAIWNHILRLRAEEGITVLMTTHYMEEAEICDHIAVIDHGKIRATGTPANLKRGLGGDRIMVVGDASLQTDMAARYQVEVFGSGDGFYFQHQHGAQFIPRMVADFNGRIRSIQAREPSLEDVFLSLTGHGIRAEEGSETDEMRTNQKLWTGKWS